MLLCYIATGKHFYTIMQLYGKYIGVAILHKTNIAMSADIYIIIAAAMYSFVI